MAQQPSVAGLSLVVRQDMQLTTNAAGGFVSMHAPLEPLLPPAPAPPPPMPAPPPAPPPPEPADPVAPPAPAAPPVPVGSGSRGTAHSTGQKAPAIATASTARPSAKAGSPKRNSTFPVEGASVVCVRTLRPAAAVICATQGPLGSAHPATLFVPQ